MLLRLFLKGKTKVWKLKTWGPLGNKNSKEVWVYMTAIWHKIVTTPLRYFSLVASCYCKIKTSIPFIVLSNSYDNGYPHQHPLHSSQPQQQPQAVFNTTEFGFLNYSTADNSNPPPPPPSSEAAALTAAQQQLQSPSYGAYERRRMWLSHTQNLER